MIVPDPGIFRCWDSCTTQAQPIGRCPHFSEGFMLDTLDEPVTSNGVPYNLSSKVSVYADSCANDFDNIGYKAECELMRCHYMGPGA